MEESELNKLTLQMFSNKGLYKRHLEKAEPEVYAKQCEYLDKIKKYKNKMREMTLSFLNDPEMDVTTEVNEMFSHFAKTLIRYIEMKRLDDKHGGCYEGRECEDSDDEGDAKDDHDTLFDVSTSESNSNSTIKHYSKHRLSHFFDKK